MRLSLTGICCSFLLRIALLSGPVVAIAQPVPLLHYTKEDGLPSNTLYNLSTDRKGYLWLGSDKGLAKFNGTKFTVYTTSDGLPDNEVFGSTEDHQGRLWITTFKGTLCYMKNGRVYTEANTPWLKLHSGNSTFYGSFQLEEDSSLTNASADSRYFLSIKGDQVRFFPLYTIAGKQGPERLGQVRKISAEVFRIWFTTRVVDIDVHMNVLAEHPYRQSYFFWLLSSPTWQIYLFFKDGIYNASDEKIFTYDSTRVHHSSAIATPDRNTLFVGMDSSLIFNNRTILTNVYVTSIIRDYSGNHWISTKSGLYCMGQNLLQTINCTGTYTGKVQAAASIGGKLFFVSNTDNFYEVSGDKVLNRSSNIRSADPQKEQYYQSYYLIQDSLLYLKFGHLSNWLFRLHKGKVESQRIPPAWEGNDQRVLKEALQDGAIIYISSVSGLLRIPFSRLFEKGRKWLNVDTLVSVGDWDNRIFSRAINKRDHSLWLSRADGISKIKNREITRMPAFKQTIFRQFGFWGNYLVGRTDNNQLLICNNYDGNAVFDTVIDKRCIWEYLYPIDEHHIIIATNNHYRLLTLLHGTKDGHPGYRLTIIENPFLPQQAEFIAADTNYCFFFKDGTVTRTETRLLFESTASPMPVFVSLKANGQTYPVTSPVVLNYSASKSINITFDNISYGGKDITCDYAITKEGREEWLPITGNEINLNTPGFGDYTIKVRSRTLSSSYSKPVVLQLRILRPYWATWWFITLCIMGLIALVWVIVYLIIWRRLRKNQKEHEADMKYQQSEYKALNALMNPHFIFNSLNNIQGLINKDEKRIANEYLVIFSDLVRQNMHNISRGFISLQQELNLVENYLTLEKLRFKELINYELRIDDTVDTEDILIPPLMIQPLVENAVKHGLLPKQSTESMISIHVFERDELLYVEIIDNGIGITQSLLGQNKLHESYGLSNLKKRTEHLKKIQQREIDINVTELKEGGQVLGTKAVITMGLTDN